MKFLHLYNQLCFQQFLFNTVGGGAARWRIVQTSILANISGRYQKSNTARNGKSTQRKAITALHITLVWTVQGAVCKRIIRKCDRVQ